MSLSKDERNRIMDFFEPWELVQLLKVDYDALVELLEDEIEDALPDLNEIMEFGEDG